VSCLEQILAELSDKHYASIVEDGIWNRHKPFDIHKQVAAEYCLYLRQVMIPALHLPRRVSMPTAHNRSTFGRSLSRKSGGAP